MNPVSSRPPLNHALAMPKLGGLKDSFKDLSGHLKQGLDELTDRALDRSVRLAVTGLSQSGKTVFITALIHQLLVGSRLPFFRAADEGRFLGAKLVAQTDTELPTF